jgi:hypothetical protein
MKTSLHYTLLCGALILVSQNAIVRADDTPPMPDKPIGRKESALVTLKAEVTAIDLKEREITLKGPRGNEVTFTVGKEVKRLDEVKVGDLVRADYYVSVAAELRKPTADEEKNPLQVIEAAGKAPKSDAPAAAGARSFKAVTTIVAIDSAAQTVTVKGPRGRLLTAKVANPDNLAAAKVGDNIVIIYTEALAISLEKVQ